MQETAKEMAMWAYKHHPLYSNRLENGSNRDAITRPVNVAPFGIAINQTAAHGRWNAATWEKLRFDGDPSADGLLRAGLGSKSHGRNALEEVRFVGCNSNDDRFIARILRSGRMHRRTTILVGVVANSWQNQA
jgi:hypothetical protein